ncbi:hypothetical protein [Caballeronia sp. S22]|uniref:hypothetical protein n=1 Tax=Caballeronia sp. S22 TaxID=3137182 RepID=UPI0035312819
MGLRRRQRARFAALGVRVVPVGYVPELTRIRFAEPRDIDVLFIGSLCPRRARVIERMRAAGIGIVAAFGVYGRARDRLIARAKLLFNVHGRADIEFEYKPQDDKGALGGAVKFGWDVRTTEVR